VSKHTVTMHDLQTAIYTQQWFDPAQEQVDRLRTRKRLAISAMEQDIERLQQQIAGLKAELADDSETKL